MTKEEFVYLYGHIEVSFSSYYKYTFTFSGTLGNGDRIVVNVGGSDTEIYRFSVEKDEKYLVKDLDTFSGRVKNLDGEIIADFWTY